MSPSEASAEPYAHPQSTPPPRSRTALLWYAAAWASLVALGLVFGLLVIEARKESPDGLDRATVEWLQEHREDYPAVTGAAKLVTRLGDDVYAHVLVITLAAGLLGLARGKPGLAWRHEWRFFLAVTLVGTALGRAIKRLVGRPRPEEELRLLTETSASFPSGHSVFAGVVFGMLALLVARGLGGLPGCARVAGVVACLALAIGMAASRVWLGVHYPSDVVGGLALGLAWVGLAWGIRGRLVRRGGRETG